MNTKQRLIMQKIITAGDAGKSIARLQEDLLSLDGWLTAHEIEQRYRRSTGREYKETQREAESAVAKFSASAKAAGVSVEAASLRRAAESVFEAQRTAANLAAAARAAGVSVEAVAAAFEAASSRGLTSQDAPEASRALSRAAEAATKPPEVPENAPRAIALDFGAFLDGIDGGSGES